MAYSHRPPIYKSVAPVGITYVGIPVHDGGILGAYIAWKDATSSAAITLELTSVGAEDAPVGTAGTWQWKDSGIAIAGPAASAPGAVLVNVENVRQWRARLKIVATAASDLEIYDGIRS